MKRLAISLGLLEILSGSLAYASSAYLKERADVITTRLKELHALCPLDSKKEHLPFLMNTAKGVELNCYAELQALLEDWSELKRDTDRLIGSMEKKAGPLRLNPNVVSPRCGKTNTDEPCPQAEALNQDLMNAVSPRNSQCPEPSERSALPLITQLEASPEIEWLKDNSHKTPLKDKTTSNGRNTGELIEKVLSQSHDYSIKYWNKSCQYQTERKEDGVAPSCGPKSVNPEITKLEDPLPPTESDVKKNIYFKQASGAITEATLDQIQGNEYHVSWYEHGAKYTKIIQNSDLSHSLKYDLGQEKSTLRREDAVSVPLEGQFYIAPAKILGFQKGLALVTIPGYDKPNKQCWYRIEDLRPMDDLVGPVYEVYKNEQVIGGQLKKALETPFGKANKTLREQLVEQEVLSSSDADLLFGSLATVYKAHKKYLKDLLETRVDDKSPDETIGHKMLRIYVKAFHPTTLFKDSTAHYLFHYATDIQPLNDLIKSSERGKNLMADFYPPLPSWTEPKANDNPLHAILHNVMMRSQRLSGKAEELVKIMHKSHPQDELIKDLEDGVTRVRNMNLYAEKLIKFAESIDGLSDLHKEKNSVELKIQATSDPAALQSLKAREKFLAKTIDKISTQLEELNETHLAVEELKKKGEPLGETGAKFDKQMNEIKAQIQQLKVK